MVHKPISYEQKALGKKRKRQRDRERRQKLKLDKIFKSQCAKSMREYRKRKKMEESKCEESQPPTSLNVDKMDKNCE